MWLYGFAKGVVTPIFRLIYRIQVEGLENIPQEGGAIFCLNHSHVLDPLLVGVFSPRRVSFMAKQEIFTTPVLGTIARGLAAFPVKRGQPDRAALKRAIDLLKGGECFGIFPEGTRSRDGRLRKAEPGTAYLAVKAGAPVIPIGITTTYRIFSPIIVRIGPPVSLGDLSEGKLTGDRLDAAGSAIMTAIGRLVEPPVTFAPE